MVNKRIVLLVAIIVSVLFLFYYEIIRAVMIVVSLFAWPLAAGYPESRKHGILHGSWTSAALGMFNFLIMFGLYLLLGQDLGLWIWIIFSTLLLFILIKGRESTDEGSLPST
jgi:hypothetical protein